MNRRKKERLNKGELLDFLDFWTGFSPSDISDYKYYKWEETAYCQISDLIRESGE